ncbi:MAG TPA: PAS domain S-box protein, partial [Candidatus Eisenbacteria bacterium]|nr:PAS domain S-box protein [Candidatus Eisenbacteria bacterium]
GAPSPAVAAGAALSLYEALALGEGGPAAAPLAARDALIPVLAMAGIADAALFVRDDGGTLRLEASTGFRGLTTAALAAAFAPPGLLESAGDAPGPRPLRAGTGGPAASLGGRSVLIVPLVVAGHHLATAVLASDEHDLGSKSWTAFARELGERLAPPLALGRTLAGLARSEALARGAIEQAPNGILVSDASGRIVQANRQIERILGYAETELVGRGVETLMPERYRGAHAHMRAAFQANREARRMGPGRDLQALHRQGHEVAVEIGLATVIRDGETFVISSLIDITDRRRAEEALRESERRARTLFETVRLVVLGLDRHGCVDYVNPYFLELTGHAREEVLGRPWVERFLPEAVRPEVHGVLTAMLEGGRHPHHVNPILTRAGEERLIAWNNTVLRDERGDPSGTLSIGEDITQRIRLEEQLRQSQRIEAVGRLAGGVAHDFNNVLTAILGYGNLLRGDVPAQGPAAEKLDEILKAAQHAAGLTRQLLAFTRQQVLAPQVLNLNGLVAEVEQMLHRLIGENVQLRTRLARDLGNVRADPGQLQQVIVNLAVNARDAMPEGGSLVLETANAALTEAYAEEHVPVVPGDYVMLAVSDTGAGMAPEVRARIFEPFFTTKEHGKGTGLGLATVYGIVKQSGGYIWAYSEPGRGSTFKIYLPRVGEPLEAAGRRPVGSPLQGRETVLLAEDDERLRPLIRDVLAGLGYTVLAAEDAGAALAAARAHAGPIELLVTDVVLPGESGRELARALSALRPATRVRYISGYTDDTVVQQGMLEPGGAFL